jgi:hypothetical protein
MYAVKNSPHALLVALVPLAVVQAILLAMALLATQALPRRLNLPAPDMILILYVARLALDASLLFAGHWALRQAAISSRIAYALMGGVMAATGYGFAIRNGLMLSPPASGSEITSGLLPAVAGMFAGFLYGQFAGLAPVAARPRPVSEGPREPPSFDGPIRVRTSVAAAMIAATVPAALTSVLAFMLLSLFLPDFFSQGGGSGAIFAAAFPGQMFLTVWFATIVPSAIFVLSTHHIARALRRTRGFEYAATGSIVAGLCALLIAPLMSVTSIFVLLAPGLVYGAIMAGLYRRFAGLEPVPLPEVVIATDATALVGADHPSRRQHSVILTN